MAKKEEDKGNETKECNLMAELMYQKQFNVGKYENEIYKIAIQGSYNEIKDGKSLIPLLMPTLFNMQLVVDKTQKRIKLEEVLKKQEENNINTVVPPVASLQPMKEEIKINNQNDI